MDVLNRAGHMTSEGTRFEAPPAGLSPIEPRLGTKFHDVHPDHDLMLDLYQPLLGRSPDDGGWDHDIDEKPDNR